MNNKIYSNTSYFKIDNSGRREYLVLREHLFYGLSRQSLFFWVVSQKKNKLFLGGASYENNF
jgi:hypothetical protein